MSCDWRRRDSSEASEAWVAWAEALVFSRRLVYGRRCQKVGWRWEEGIRGGLPSFNAFDEALPFPWFNEEERQDEEEDVKACDG